MVQLNRSHQEAADDPETIQKKNIRGGLAKLRTKIASSSADQAVSVAGSSMLLAM